MEKIAPESARPSTILVSPMSAIALNAVIDSDSPGPGDADLVERFVVARDQRAFAELVCRHSAVVLGVARRVLNDSHDIDDVFQATFLVFVRNAARIRKRKSLASWLYGVAYRLSLRVARQKQRRRETGLVEESLIDGDLLDKLTDRHDQQLVDIELNALPERYRQPLVLKYLSGHSTSDIASELGTTVGAIEGLLKRGKDELRRRLLQRGITLGIALAAIQITQRTTEACAAESLIDATIQGGLAWNSDSNTPSSDWISHQAVELARKELFAMATTSKTTLALGLTLGGLVMGLGGANILTGPSRGTADAGGLNTTIAVTRLSNEIVNLTTLAADPDGDDPVSSPAGRKRNLKLEVNSPTNAQSGLATDQKRVPWDLKPRSPNVIKIENALLNTSEASLIETPLTEALQYFEDLHNIEIHIDVPALAEEGIAPDQNVNLVKTGITLKSMLNLILEPLQLDYVIKNEVMVITTQAKAQEMFETRVYNAKLVEGHTAHELMELIIALIEPDSWESGRSTVSAATPSQDSAGPGSDMGGMPGMMPIPATETAVVDPSNLQAKSKGSMPGSGMMMGMMPHGMGGVFGGGGVIRVAKNNTLVIRQTQKVHDEIIELLNQLK